MGAAAVNNFKVGPSIFFTISSQLEIKIKLNKTSPGNFKHTHKAGFSLAISSDPSKLIPLHLYTSGLL